MKYIKFFKELNNRDVPIVGGKMQVLAKCFKSLCLWESKFQMDLQSQVKPIGIC